MAITGVVVSGNLGPEFEVGTGPTADKITIKVDDASIVRNGATGELSAPGVPSGGTVGQTLAKASGTAYDTEWVDGPIVEQTGTGTGRTIFVQLDGEAAPAGMVKGDILVAEA